MPLTSNNPIQTSQGDSPSIDAFSRQRVSDPVTIFDSQSQFGNSDLFWETATTGGSITNSLNESAVILSTGGTTSGNLATRQTRIYHRYQPGHSQMVLMTFVMSAAYSNVRTEVGYNDASNGIFLRRDGSTVSLVRRTKTSGTVVDNVVPQSEWNIDTMNGSGICGKTLDLTKTQILVMDLQWLGVGRVRVGFDIDGVICYVHEFKHANILTSPYMTTANLPVRAHITNTSTAGGTGTLKFICCTVISEGGFEERRGLQFSTNRGSSLLAVTTRRPVLSLRAKTTGPNSVVNTGQIIPKNFTIVANTNECLVEIVRNGTLTGASFADFNSTYSLTQVDTAATAISGGLVVDSFYVATGEAKTPAAASRSPFGIVPILYATLNGTQDILSVVVTSLNSTSNVAASVTWQEYY